jgi:NitT/TauT family transport system substrate-binding protein
MKISNSGVTRRIFVASSTVLLASNRIALPATLERFVVTEPIHAMDSLPFYLAIKRGFFNQAGLDVQLITSQGGGEYFAALIAGNAQGVIGGPEHIAFSAAKGGKAVRAVVAISNRANQYLVAGKSITVPQGSLRDKLKGKRIALGPRGGTPFSIMLYLLGRENLDPKTDVTLLEIPNAAGCMAAVKVGRADYASLNEPLITEGVKQGVFQTPFLSMPNELGPFAYTTVNVPLELVDKNPKLVQGLVDGVKQGLEAAFADRAGVLAFAKAEFPDVKPEDVDAVVNRALDDDLWERTGALPLVAWTKLEQVVRGAGLLQRDMPYDSIFDPRFLA